MSSPETHSSSQPLNVAITGASGLVGSQLSEILRQHGHTVLPVVRRDPEDPSEIYWNPSRGEIDAEGFNRVDAVVHLAGENIFALRWTEEKKRRIRESRVGGTALLSEALASVDDPPDVLISASGVHYYGDCGDQKITEASPPGDGFLAGVVQDWEAATGAASDAGIRVVSTRFGVILSRKGGALETMQLPYKMGLGGRIGDGQQFMSWIALDDVVGAIEHVLATDSLRGPVNLTSPNPVTNREFTETLGDVLNRPTPIPVPKMALKVALGEMGEELLLMGARVLPTRLLESGYEFLYPDLDAALRHELGRD